MFLILGAICDIDASNEDEAILVRCYCYSTTRLPLNAIYGIIQGNVQPVQRIKRLHAKSNTEMKDMLR